jgi:hypothetical protein
LLTVDPNCGVTLEATAEIRVSLLHYAALQAESAVRPISPISVGSVVAGTIRKYKPFFLITFSQSGANLYLFGLLFIGEMIVTRSISVVGTTCHNSRI